MTEHTFTSRSVEETETIAADLARNFTGGEVIALEGDLGAGKTQFVRGIVRALGGNTRAVSSPTYILLNIYPQGRLTVFHLDAYRVAGPSAFDDIGFTELLDHRGVVVVEWASRVESLLDASTIRVSITAIDEQTRSIRVVT